MVCGDFSKNKKPRLITAGATTKKLSYENKNFLSRMNGIARIQDINTQCKAKLQFPCLFSSNSIAQKNLLFFRCKVKKKMPLVQAAFSGKQFCCFYLSYDQ
jgi:hypothetical protein